ncbi:MAG TPA: MFS transporter [Candidatus Sulfotelmatobacter sp.]|jgi:ACS family hexuronate transporter-like MFS transporter
MERAPRPIPSLRWWIGGLLFASTVINYIDRQTLSLLAPYLKIEFHWTNSDYANLAIAFRVAYSIGQSAFGRLMDRTGTRRGLTITVICYSIVSMATSLARGFYSFATFRFLLGAGESANWPGATKAVSEWFPKRERALATALFDSGSSIGGAIAPFIVLAIYFRWGWRPAFAVPGVLGFLWLIAWRWLYFPPEEHPSISDKELAMIMDDKRESSSADSDAGLRWSDLLRLPQTWATIIAKSSTDPIFFFITEWFPIYLVAKGIELRSGLIAIWIPFIAADVGSFVAGWFSGYLVRRGVSLGWARRIPIIYGGIGMTLLVFTIFTTNLYTIAFLFAVVTFTYAGFTVMANTLPSDLFESRSVASVSGLGGTATGIGTIVAFKLVGYLSDSRQAAGTHSFDPIIIAASIVPFVGMILTLLLLCNNDATERGLVRRI